MNNKELGTKFEQRAAAYLNNQGLHIVEMNYRNRTGEIDIIARDGNCLVFVEVKYRKTASKGHPEEAVNLYKVKKICKVANHYLLYKKFDSNTQIRFDVVAIEDDTIRWYKNAFSYVY